MSTGPLTRLFAGFALLAASAAPAAPLTLAVADLPGFAPALVAEAQGYYAAEGLDLKLLHCVNGFRCLKHLLAGEAQIATVAETPLVMAAHAGARFDIVATFGVSREYRLVARADRGIRSIADLKGRRIGYIQGTSLLYFAQTLLTLDGVDPATVTLVPLAAGTHVDSLVRGDVDAGAFYHPHVGQVLQRLGGNAVLPDRSRSILVTFNLVSAGAPEPVADEDLRKLLRALRRACDFIDTQPDKARALLADVLKTDTAALAAIWDDYRFRLALDQTLINMLESQSRWAVREGLVPQAATPDFLDRVRPGPLRAVEPRAVTLVK